MGEAVYTLKASFKDVEAGAKKLRKLLTQVGKAYDYWQDNRGKTPEQFWPKFKAKFPLAVKLLSFTDVKIGGDCGNALAGLLSYCEYSKHLDLDSGGGADGSGIVIYRAEVWHFANWRGLGLYVRDVLGGTRVSWKSSEYEENEIVLEDK